MNITIDTHSGGLAFWHSVCEVPRAVVHTAAANAGISRFVPTAPPVSLALRESMDDFASRAFGKRRNQPIVILQTQQPRTFECVRVVRQAAVNDHRFLFSARVDLNGDVTVMETNDGETVTDGRESATRARLQTALQDAVLHQLTILPGPMVTQVIVKGLKDWGCQCLTERGGLWFIPGSAVPLYQSWAESMAATGCRFTHCEVLVSKNPEFVEHLLDELRAEVTEGITAITEAMLKTTGGMQDRSVRPRIKRAEAFLEKIAKYEQVTGVTLNDLRGAAEQAKTALGIQRLLAASV